jgi:CheY-like chemotaxis protein
VEVLQSFNYNVIEAENGDTAIAMWPSLRDEVDLLLTDMVMPGTANGLDVARHCLGNKPDLKVIFTSGYSSELFGSNVKLQEGVNYLPKPYLSNKLTTIIRNALEPEGAVAVPA